MEDIIKRIVSEHFHLSIQQLECKSRKRELAVARQTAMKLIRERTKLSLTNIGKLFENRDHSTVIHCLTAIQDLIDTNIKFNQTWKDLSHKVDLAERPRPELIYKDGEFKAA